MGILGSGVCLRCVVDRGMEFFSQVSIQTPRFIVNSFLYSGLALLLCLVMFFGGAVAIMTFHEDVDMGRVHSDIYAFFTGVQQENVPVVSVPYSIGVAVGFVMLFGLYKRRKNRPTVLDIDIHNYENELRDYLTAQGNRPDG